MGTSPPGDTYNTTGEGVPLINGPVEFSPGSFGKTVRTKFTTAPNKLCKENDLILCVRGSTTGKLNIAGFDACIGRGVAAIRAKEYQPWINHFISSKTEDIYRLGTGATFPNISTAALAGLTLLMPPLAEQRRIVGILDETFEGLATAKANAEQNLQNARALFESHLQAVFTQRGDGWVETTIGDQMILQRGFDITKDQQSPGDVPVVSSGGIKSVHNKAMAEGPGVVIGRKGTLGKVFYLPNVFWPHDTTLWVKEFKGNHPRFVYYFFRNLDVAHLDTGTANPAYFGEPVYIYSLKDGINDGFLTPFKVKQIQTTLDEYVYTSDDKLIEGEIEAGKIYEEKDFNKIIEIKERERHRVKLFMGMIDQRQKTLVFCATQIHALAVRDLINQIKTSKDPNYCQRVTANDGALGEQHLRDFQDNEKTIPTILTTSQKLSTGVDARNIRNIVLMRPINSIIEFKQIIGRGTRLYDGKDFFTIYDFVKAHQHFSDPEWDGEPLEPEDCPKCGQHPCVCEKEPPEPCSVCGERPCVCPKDPCPICGKLRCVCKKKKKAKVKLADGKERLIQHMMMTSFWHPDGTPMSAQEFMTLLFGKLPEFFKDEAELRALWSAPDTRSKLMEGLAENGFGLEQMTEMQRIIDAEKSDLFDVLAYVAYALPTLTREQRADMAKVEINSHFNAKQQAFLAFVLGHYVSEGVQELSQDKPKPLLRLKYNNSIADAIADLGRAEDIGSVFANFQQYLYQGAA